MSLTSILNSARSGLAASQTGMQTVATNIANVGTAGYARQVVSQSASVAGGNVNGVVVGEPSRVADKFLENAVYRRAGTSGRAEAASDYLDRLQSLLGSPSSDAGLAARLDAIASSASQIAGLQGSSEAIALFTGNVSDTIDTLNGLQSDVLDLTDDVSTEASDTVDRINTLLAKIHGYNADVARLQGLGLSVSGPADSRMSALEELSGLIDVTVREQADGRVTIDTASGQALLDKRLRQLDDSTATTGNSGITIRFATDDGKLGAATGERIDSSTVGGKLGGLYEMRDKTLPGVSEQLGQLFSGLAQALNKVSNEGTTVPPPQTLTGQANGLIGSDRAGFTGKATFAVLAIDGTLVASTTVDFDALGADATLDEVVARINDGLSPAAAASFTDGVLSLSAASSSYGVAVAQDADAPSDRGGVGFSQFFGLNNLIRSDTSALVPSGFTTDDPLGFAEGETAQLVLRDTSGKVLATQVLTGSDGATWGDAIDALNSGALGAYGSFALDETGRVAFTPLSANSGATVSIPVDSTDRYGTGLSFSALSGLSGSASGLSSAQVSAAMLSDPAKLPLARLQLDAAVGEKALGNGDIRGADGFSDAIGAISTSFGKDGKTSITLFAAKLLGGIGSKASLAKTTYEDASARLADATGRRDSYSGVNVDEELANMVVLQNSYSAAARVMTTASQMYDSLLNMV